MELVAQEKDKQGRPIGVFDISTEEVEDVKKAVTSHPKFKASDEEGMRFRALSQKESWNKLSNINIKDIKEAVNKYIQDHDEPQSSMDVLHDQLHQVWKKFNPS